MTIPVRARWLLLAALAAAAPPAAAQPYARFAVPDNALGAALRTGAAGYEAAWNALLVAHLRARLAPSRAAADTAAALLRLARRVAAAEPEALGSHIGRDALGLLARWSRAAVAARVRAAVAESLAVAAQSARDWTAADRLFRAALGDYRGLGERRREAWVLGSLGVVAFSSGNLDRADSLYREALRARQALGDPRMLGNTLNVLGSTNYLRTRYAEAYGFLQAARAVRERTGERAALGSTLNTLGLTHLALGHPDSAEVCWRQALELTVSQGDSARTGEVLTSLGQMSERRGETGEALALYRRALEIMRQRGDARLEAQVLLNVGSLERRQGHFTAAAVTFETALARARDAGDARGEVQALNNLAGAWLALDDPGAARPALERGLALAESLGSVPLQAPVLNHLVIAARLEGDAYGVSRLGARALRAAEEAGDSLVLHGVAMELGKVAFEANDPEAAARWFARAAAAGAGLGPEGRAGDRINLGIVTLPRSLEEAERHFRDALRIASQAEAPDMVWPALHGLGEVAERRGDFSSALAFDRQAATIVDTLRARQGAEPQSISLFAGRLYGFEALIHLLVKLDAREPGQGHAAEAFAWAERARARALLDLMAAHGLIAPRAAPPTPAEVSARLGPREALLLYSLGDSSSTLWAVRRDGWRCYTLPPRQQLRTRVEILRRGLSAPASAESRATRDAARALYRTLVAPAEPLLKGVEHLRVSPDGVLALIPFEVLLAADVRGDGPVPRGGYLGERRAVSYVPAAAGLVGAAESAGTGSMLVVADPRFGTAAAGERGAPALPPLPNTALELEALRAVAGGRRLVAFTGDQATRERLLDSGELARAQLVHLATHGTASEDHPEKIGLWLAADSSGGATRLSLDDILRLRLRADLVTLSACETGLGRLERGEGVIGLTRAFLAAGARSAVVSLWQVNDRSTARLMADFYRALLARGVARDQALAEARRALLRSGETRSPFYWAAFVLVGEPGRLP